MPALIYPEPRRGSRTEAYRWFTEENTFPLPILFFRNVGKGPHRLALDFYGRQMTYGELARHVSAFARIVAPFSNTRDEKRNCVSLFLPNIPQFVFCYYGTLLAGAIVAPINYVPLAKQLKTRKPWDVVVGDELVKQFEYSEPRVLVVAQPFLPMLKKVLQQTAALDKTTILVTNPGNFLPPLKRLLYPLKTLVKHGISPEGRKKRYSSLDLMMKYELRGEDDLRQPQELDYPLDEVAQLQYTGGSTGFPKGAMLTHRNLVSNVLQCREQIGDIVPQGARVLGALPFCHAYGLTVCMNMALAGLGGELFLVPEFSAENVCRLIEREEISLFSGSSRMFELIKPLVGRYDLSSLTYCTTGAGKAPEETIAFFRENNVPLYEGYGLSEASPVVSFGLPHKDKIGKVGCPLPGTDVKIVDVTNGDELGPNGIGELWIRGPQVMAGYKDKPEETRAALCDGWLRTGDIFTRDEEGFLGFVDRSKNMGKIRGENVYGEPIREFLLACPGVEKCVVFFVETNGESTPIAMIVLKNPDAQETLKRHLDNIPNPLWTPSKIIEVDDATFDFWFDSILSKINIETARRYYRETVRHKIIFETRV